MSPDALSTRMEEMQLVNICRANQTKHNMDCPKKYSCVHTATLSAADGAECWGKLTAAVCETLDRAQRIFLQVLL